MAESLDWTQKYLGNAKERLVISGIGSERVCSEFEVRPCNGIAPEAGGEGLIIRK